MLCTSRHTHNQMLPWVWIQHCITISQAYHLKINYSAKPKGIKLKKLPHFWEINRPVWQGWEIMGTVITSPISMSVLSKAVDHSIHSFLQHRLGSSLIHLTVTPMRMGLCHTSCCICCQRGHAATTQLGMWALLLVRFWCQGGFEAPRHWSRSAPTPSSGHRGWLRVWVSWKKPH